MKNQLQQKLRELIFKQDVWGLEDQEEPLFNHLMIAINKRYAKHLAPVRFEECMATHNFKISVNGKSVVFDLYKKPLEQTESKLQDLIDLLS